MVHKNPAFVIPGGARNLSLAVVEGNEEIPGFARNDRRQVFFSDSKAADTT
jgi:hypothetical protein